MIMCMHINISASVRIIHLKVFLYASVTFLADKEESEGTLCEPLTGKKTKQRASMC